MLKLLFKEIILPTNASKALYLLAPVMIMPAIAAWAVIPFSPELVLADINAGLLYIMALSSMGVYGVIVAGWASNSKYAFLGAMRSAAQMVSYELAMGFALVVVLMVSGASTCPTSSKGRARATSPPRGHVPLLELAAARAHAVVYFVSGVAETNRAPFDVVEGESEIVAGHMIEYSGMTFALFFLAEYMNMILISTLTAIMFFGGWQSPVDSIVFNWIPPFGWLLIKIFLIVSMFLWIRATFPRYRYDQIMRLGWKVFIPLTLVWIAVIGIWMQTLEHLEMTRDLRLLQVVPAARAVPRDGAHRQVHVLAQDHGAVPRGEDAAQPALPRPARAAPLSERRGALHRLQAVRGGLSPRSRSTSRSSGRRRHAAPRATTSTSRSASSAGSARRRPVDAIVETSILEYHGEKRGTSTTPSPCCLRWATATRRR